MQNRLNPSRRPYDRRFPQPDDKGAHRINREINVPQVRLVGDNAEPGIYDIGDALDLAEKLELDLVEITATGDIPVCRIVDYSKFLYDQKKKQKEMKAKSAKSVVKEVRFGPNTDEHDFEFKVKHAKKFLEEGSKVKAFVHFKGRTIIHSSRGVDLLARFADELEEIGKVESAPKLEGKRMYMMLAPKGKVK